MTSRKDALQRGTQILLRLIVLWHLSYFEISCPWGKTSTRQSITGINWPNVYTKKKPEIKKEWKITVLEGGFARLSLEPFVSCVPFLPVLYTPTLTSFVTVCLSFSTTANFASCYTVNGLFKRYSTELFAPFIKPTNRFDFSCFSPRSSPRLACKNKLEKWECWKIWLMWSQRVIIECRCKGPGCIIAAGNHFPSQFRFFFFFCALC